MAASIQNPVKCEERSVIRFLHAKVECPEDSHRQIVSVYGNIMNRHNVTKWCRAFSEDRTDVHEEHRTGRPSVISDALLRRTEEAMQANTRLTLRKLHKIVPEVFITTLHECVTVTLGYHKLCARWVPKMLTEGNRKKRMGFAFDLVTRYAETGDEFLNHIVTAPDLAPNNLHLLLYLKRDLAR
ncbi:hypothetical protein AVEN_104791-1 [Araneus ventricosus]|uniref:Mos1 transposase HTH domain-containing protein n=1 Tax=Araneus ventricosus TaxID=182803 RepID=A0A4Y2VRQ0_ARAVE|nr:hypothetical protein AVEN_104791-1 [Araneus ventricosus]